MKATSLHTIDTIDKEEVSAHVEKEKAAPLFNCHDNVVILAIK